MLRFKCVVSPLLLIMAIAGCGGNSFSTANSGVEPPHDGMLITLPAGKGYVEAVKKTGEAPITGEVTFYLYRDASYTPYETMPDSAVFVLDNKRSVKLQVEEDAFVTPSGPVLFGKKDVQGILRFELDGERVQLVIGDR